ncbi:signal transduction histidine kinase [Clostridium algifaecis]|uniref:Signal transduction histidine kinase n=1 Tax=Clostridium algifaecis TaxID=1472040 RepID=A0ABS4KV24_9CLOT|nr:ATP-binding protein [Clostridium algifaecis]MBP2033900.1 signal transduction histidine kinase [Clostridium algifaecis]
MNALREIILDCIESLLLLGIFEALYNKKKFIVKNKLRSILFCIIFVFATYWSTFNLPNAYHSLFISVFDILLLACITRIKIFTSAIILSVFIIMLSVTEYSTQTVEMFLFNINLDQIFLNPKYLATFLIISKMLQILIVLLLFKFSKYFAKFKLFQQKSILFSNLIIQAGILSLFIFSINYGIFNIKNAKIFNILIFILYFILLVMGFKELKEWEKVINIESSYKVQEHQIKNMEEIISIIRQEKHDFANHVNVIWGLCLLNKPNTVERIKNYVTGISDNIHSAFKFFNTGNEYLDGLLSIKNNYAMKNNIDFNITIDEPFSSIKIKENELISIISNLVDNAFEAFQLKANIENKKISVNTFIKDENFYVKISNNGDMIPQNIKSKIFDKGFSTKTKKSSDHGFGLYITKQLIEQNKGCITLESTSEKTKFLIKFEIKETDI